MDILSSPRPAKLSSFTTFLDISMVTRPLYEIDYMKHVAYSRLIAYSPLSSSFISTPY